MKLNEFEKRYMNIFKYNDISFRNGSIIKKIEHIDVWEEDDEYAIFILFNIRIKNNLNNQKIIYDAIRVYNDEYGGYQRRHTIKNVNRTKENFERMIESDCFEFEILKY